MIKTNIHLKIQTLSISGDKLVVMTVMAMRKNNTPTHTHTCDLYKYHSQDMVYFNNDFYIKASMKQWHKRDI